MKRIFIFLVFLVFIAGCAEEGVKVVKVSPGGEVRTITPPAGQQQAAPQANQTTPTANTSNQTASQPAQAGAPTNADLELNSFFLSGLNINPNEQFTIKLKIKNAGTEPISNFEYLVKIMKGADVVKSDIYNYTESLGGGAISNKIEFLYSLAEKGSYDIIVKLDPMSAFAEPNETNNEGKQRINVVTPSNASSGSPSSSGTNASTGSCKDTDGGKNYGVRGTCTDNQGTSVSDICIDINKIWEWYCENDRCQYQEHICSCNTEKGICT